MAHLVHARFSPKRRYRRLHTRLQFSRIEALRLISRRTQHVRYCRLHHAKRRYRKRLNRRASKKAA